MTAILLVVLKISVAVLILSVGLGAGKGDGLYLWHHPGKLVRALLAMYVLVPLAAFVLARFLPVDPAAKAALLVLTVSAGAPLLPRKLSGLQSRAYTYSLVVTSSLLAIIIVPAFVAALSWRFGVTTDLPVVSAMARGFLLPLAVGILLRFVFRGRAARAAAVLGGTGMIVLLLAAVVLLAIQWQVVLGLRVSGLLALIGLMAVSLTIGHFVGGPDEDERTALAIACASRHIAIAIIVATAFHGPRIAIVVSAYIIASAVVSIPYLKFRARKGTAQIT